MGSEFTAIFLFILVAIMVAVGMLLTSHFVGPRRSTPVKQMPYESGMDPIGDARQRFDIRYYLVAIMFLLFDVELLYLYPWAVAQWSADLPVASAPRNPGEARAAEVEADPLPNGRTVRPAPSPVPLVEPVRVGIPPMFRNLVFCEILVFTAVLTAAFAYAWRKGVFAWR